MPLSDATMLGMAHRFTVEVIPGKHDLGTWASVDGLDVSWDMAEYRAGDAGNDRWYFPGNTHYSVVKLTRAASSESKRVRDWLNETSFKWEPQVVTVSLLDSNHGPIMSWVLRQAMPLRWSISGFDASASRVVTETLDIAHSGFLDEVGAP